MKNLILTSILFSLASSGVNAQKVNANADNVANNGYDVVNYFTTNSAVQGSIEHSLEHNGSSYYFISEDNKEAFQKNPSSYLPQFDGYCAFAVAKMNKKVPVNPTTFRIDDGKLYLFYNDFWEGKPFNTIVPWLSNEGEMEKMAMNNWVSLKNQ